MARRHLPLRKYKKDKEVQILKMIFPLVQMKSTRKPGCGLKDRNCEKLVNPLGDWTGGTGVDITVSLIILPKQMRNGCRHWTGTLFAPLQDGIIRNTKGVTICRKWVLLDVAFTKKD